MRFVGRIAPFTKDGPFRITGSAALVVVTALTRSRGNGGH